MEQTWFWYRLYGCTVRSEVEYPHLLDTDSRTEDLTIRISELKRRIKDPKGCFVDTITRDRIYFCNQVGCFLITGGTQIEICPNPGVEIEAMTPFVFGYCIAMLFWQRGLTAIHCSAVEKEGKALLISGYSGAGKSTLTTVLLENGYRLMTDDVAILKATDDEIIVYPAFPQQKLCRDAVERNRMDTRELIYIDEDRDKYAIPRKDHFCQDPCELIGIICLNVHKEQELVFGEIAGAGKLTAFLENLFLFPMFRANQVFTPQDMQWCLDVVQRVPVYGMIRPEGMDCTAQQLKIVDDRIFGNQ